MQGIILNRDGHNCQLPRMPESCCPGRLGRGHDLVVQGRVRNRRIGRAARFTTTPSLITAAICRRWGRLLAREPAEERAQPGPGVVDQGGPDFRYDARLRGGEREPRAGGDAQRRPAPESGSRGGPGPIPEGAVASKPNDDILRRRQAAHRPIHCAAPPKPHE